jgi:non-ribosomal peptide synthetase component F
LLTEAPLPDALALAPRRLRRARLGHIDRSEETRALPEVAADALVYFFYTSGSTGQPKGVSQTHASLLFFVDAYAKTLRIEEADRVSLLYSLSFSAANMDIFGALLNGAALCSYDLRRDGLRHLAGCRCERITVLHVVQRLCELAASLPPGRRLPHLKAIDLGGESVFGSDVERSSSTREHHPRQSSGGDRGAVVAQYVIEHGSRPEWAR